MASLTGLLCVGLNLTVVRGCWSIVGKGVTSTLSFSGASLLSFSSGLVERVNLLPMDMRQLDPLELPLEACCLVAKSCSTLLQPHGL